MRRDNSYDKHDHPEEHENPYDDYTEQMADEVNPPKSTPRRSLVLERSCPYREGGEPSRELPDTTHQQLAELVDLGKKLGTEFEGICVTDATTIFYSPEDSLFIPNRGYRVQDAFAPYGGVEATIDQCGRCLANIDPEDHPNKRLAACHGELKVVADHPLFAPVVQQAIKNRGLRDAVAERFLKTNPPCMVLDAIPAIRSLRVPCGSG